MHLTSIFSLLVGVATCASVDRRQTSSYPLPEPCTGGACYGPGYGDCSIIIKDGTYYRFSKANKTGMGLEVALAPSLRGPWEYRNGTVFPGPIMDPVGSPRSSTNLWAPEIHFINNLYYLFYGIFNPSKGFDIAVATSKTLKRGSFVDHGSIRVPEFPPNSKKRIWTRLGVTLLVNASDPSGEAANHFLAFGSYQSGLYGIRMADPPLTIAPGATPVELVADQPIPTNSMNNRMNRTEGPYLYKRSPTQYFIFYSRGSTAPSLDADPGDVYRIEVCRATAATGPYMDRAGRLCTHVRQRYGPAQPGTLVLASHDNNAVFAPGSMGILQDPVEGLVMYYQYFNGTTKQSKKEQFHHFGFNYLEFTSDGWPVLVAQRSSVG